MTDQQPNQAMPTDKVPTHRGSDDDGTKKPAGWSGGGESGGGARPQNPDGGGDAGSHGGFMGHGGQSHAGYSGTGDDDGEENANAAAKE